MDTKTHHLNFGDNDLERLREVLKRMGDFIAYFEIVEDKIGNWKNTVSETIVYNEQFLAEQLHELRLYTDELKGFMDETGIARYKLLMQESLQLGKDRVKILDGLTQKQSQIVQNTNEEIKELAKKSFERLDRASSHTIKNISEAIASFRITDFEECAEKSCKQVETTSKSAISEMKKMVKWFHWKNILLSLGITLVASVTLGLFINDEMLWETRKQVITERNAGRALIHAWPSLSASEQQHIIQYSER